MSISQSRTRISPLGPESLPVSGQVSQREETGWESCPHHTLQDISASDPAFCVFSLKLRIQETFHLRTLESLDSASPVYWSGAGEG